MSQSSLITAICFCTIALLVGCASNETKVVPAPSAPAAAPESEYRIGPGDQLNVFVFNHPDLSQENVPVRPDGLISIPLAEDITAAGRTPSELARELEIRLAEYVRTPTVNVIMTGFRGSLADQIRVVGAAAKPQSLPYRANITLLDVMIEVGGLGQFAAGNRARLIRRSGDKQLEIPLRLDDLLNDGDISANVPIQPGDVIIIPETRF